MSSSWPFFRPLAQRSKISLVASTSIFTQRFAKSLVPLSGGIPLDGSFPDLVCQRLPLVEAAHPLPPSLAAFTALAFDGKKLQRVLHRLKPMRGLHGTIFGGKRPVVQDRATRQAVADGETAAIGGVVASVDEGGHAEAAARTKTASQVAKRPRFGGQDPPRPPS